VVALYVTDLAATYKPSTISRRLASISIIHKTFGYNSPTADTRVQNVTRGVRRRLGTSQTEARPLVIGDLRRMLAHLPETTAGVRDRALLLVGFAGAFRRSELVAIDLDDLDRRDQGIVVHLRRSKTDPEAAGREVALPRGHDPHTCPIAAIDAWIGQAAISDGALFRAVDRHGNVGERLTGQSVTLVIRRAAAAANIEVAQLSGHSLRAGFATTAAANGASEATIARQTGHRSMDVLRKYIRHGTVFTDNAVTQVGL
jgi:integrase